jgi:pyruvate dehydrogenase (quinone)
MKVGDFVVERLHTWGVRRIYGYPGDGINGVIAALQRANNIEFIQVRHEEMALLPLIKRKEDRDWLKNIESNVTAWWKKLEGRAMAEAKPVNPQRVIWEMSPVLPANAIVSSDSGSCVNWFARDYRVQQGQLASLSGGLASMGAAVPYAIGAKFAHPDRPVVALVGDGAMQMNNMAELITVQKYWKR